MSFSIVSDKKTEYSIVIPAAFSEVEKVAAEELQQYLKKALSVELPIVKEGEETGKAFYIGYTEFAKANEQLEIKAGFVDGKVIDVNEVKVYASIPNKETLIAKMLGSLQAPIGNLVRTLDAIAKKDEAAAE